MVSSLWMVRLWIEGFFDLSNFMSRSLCTHVSYGPLHAMSGLTVNSSMNAKGGGGVKEAVSLHAHVFRRWMCHSVCQFEMSCLGYMYSAGSELWHCKNANWAACNGGTPHWSWLVRWNMCIKQRLYSTKSWNILSITVDFWEYNTMCDMQS